MVESGSWDGEPDRQYVLIPLETSQQSWRHRDSVREQDETERGADEELPWQEEASLFPILGCKQ